MQEISNDLREAVRKLDELDHSRPTSIAKTHIEEADHWLRQRISELKDIETQNQEVE